MTTRLLFLAATLVGASPAVANESPLILSSAFEDAEGCLEFNGLNRQIPINTINLTGSFSLNGGDFPQVEFDDARFFLRDRATGGEVFLGESTDGGYNINLLPGRYDVVYEVESRGASVPRNDEAIVQEDVGFFDDQVFDIDIGVVSIGGDFTLNGGPFPANEFDDATFKLVSETLGEVFLGDSKDQGYASVPLLPGTYQVFYSVESRGGNVPHNTLAPLGEMVVTVSANDRDIDVPSVTLTGEFRNNGALFPAIEYDDGNFFLESLAGDQVFLGNSHDQTYVRNLVPGTYNVVWEAESRGDTVPFNDRARLDKVSVNGGQLDIDVETVEINGAFTVNKQPFPASDLQQGRMLLYDPVADVYSQLGLTKDQAYTRNVLTGSYDFVYQHLDGDQVPQNKGHTLLAGEAITKDRTIGLNVRSGTYSASIFQNGALFPADANQAGVVVLQGAKSDDIVLLGSTAQQTFSERVVPGLYDVYYLYVKGDQVPGNVKALIAEDVEVSAPLLRELAGGQTAAPAMNNDDLHVTAYSYPGSFLLNGAPTPGVAFDDGNVFLHLGEDRVLIGKTSDQTFNVRVIYETGNSKFEVRYEAESTNGVMPLNRDTRLTCAKLLPPIL